MVYASRLSEKFLGFNATDRVIQLLEQYGLPTAASFKMEKVLSILRMDKKRVSRQMNYILLEKVGKGVIYPIELKTLEQELLALG
jgi:3-dehydroquinate synthase